MIRRRVRASHVDQPQTLPIKPTMGQITAMSCSRSIPCAVFSIVAACAAENDGDQTAAETGTSTSEHGGSASTDGETSTSDHQDAGSSSSGVVQWPECLAPSGPDVDVAIVLDPPQPDSMWHRYSGTCTVASAEVQGSTASVALDCSGGDGPAPEWSTTLTVTGFDGALPESVAEGASVELVVVLQLYPLRFSAFSLVVDGEVILAGFSGNDPDVEEGMGGPPQGLWAPLVVSTVLAQVCAEQPGVKCPLSVARNAVVFSGLDEPAIEAFDHSFVEATLYEYRTGRALAYVDDGSGMVCEGSAPTWYDFVVSRRP